MGTDLTSVVRDAGEAKAHERGLETKSLDRTDFGWGTKVLDESQGIASMLVAVTGVEDHVHDIIEPGAIGPQLKSRWPKGIWHHTWESPIAKTLDARELMPGDPELPTTLRDGSPWPAAAGALKIDAQFNLETQRGREAFSDVKFFGEGQEWSIGYKVKQASRTKDGIRHIKAMEVPEYSPVLFGAMPLATTLSTKEDGTPLDEKAAYVNLPGTLEEMQDDVEDAIEAMLPSQGIDTGSSSVRVVGTYADRVIYSVCNYGGPNDGPISADDDDEKFYEAPYTRNEEGQVVVGVPHEVDVNAAVTEKSDDPLIAALEVAGELTAQTKAGRVLSGSNKAKVKAALGALQELLTVAGDEEAGGAKDDDGSKADPMAKKPHEYKPGEDGKCATCGTAKGNPMHSVKADAAPAADEKPHAYEAGPFGKCKVCGKMKDDPIHNTKADAGVSTEAGPDSTTHEYNAGQGGYCSKCGLVMTHPIHDAPYGRSYGGPVDGVGGDNGSKDDVVSEAELLQWERERLDL